MEWKQKRQYAWGRPAALSAVLILLALALALGSAFARYQVRKDADLQFETKTLEETGASGLSMSAEWESTGESMVNRVTVQNETDQEKLFSVRSLVSSGIGAGENVSVKLSVAGDEFRGQPSAIAEGSLLEESFGPGWVFRFPGENETLFHVGAKAQVELTVTLSRAKNGDGTYVVFPGAAMMRTEIIPIESGN